MDSVSTGECRCGMYLVDHVRSMWGRMSLFTSSSTFSNPFPFSGRNPNDPIFPRRSYGSIPENALSSEYESNIASRVSPIMRENLSFTSSVSDSRSGSFADIGVDLFDGLLED